jgi:hypothetical protein
MENKITQLKARLFDLRNQIDTLNQMYQETMVQLRDEMVKLQKEENVVSNSPTETAEVKEDSESSQHSKE